MILTFICSTIFDSCAFYLYRKEKMYFLHKDIIMGVLI